MASHSDHFQKDNMTVEKMLAPPAKRLIHKFPAVNSKIKLGLPAKFLDVQVQYGSPQMWVEHCPDSAVQVEAEIRVFVTGAEVPPEFNYLGTWQDGMYVLHAYVNTVKK